MSDHNDFLVTKAYATATCKFGQGEPCCKYLMIGPKGFECAKLNLPFRQLVDARTNMRAKGDNCAGKPDELAAFLND